MRKLGQKLRMLRENRGLSLRQLAAELGVTHSHLILIENSKRTPSVELLVKLAAYFEVTTDQLLNDKIKLNL